MKILKNHKISFLVVSFLVLLVIAINNAPSYAASGCVIDHVISLGEACDDGNAKNSDGCSTLCTLESGWSCISVRNTVPLTGNYSVCTRTPVCTNGIKETGENCDDGNSTNFDGCNNLCQIESGWGCTGSPSVCDELCGNNIVDSGEACDDGANVLTGVNGCYRCGVVDGYTCSGSPSVCSATCGDSIIAGTEECDDGNTNAFDGCDNCQTSTMLGPSANPPGGNVTPTFTGLTVSGNFDLQGLIINTLTNLITFGNNVSITGNLSASGTLNITGDTTLGAIKTSGINDTGALSVSGDTYLAGTLNSGAITTTGITDTGNLSVTGNSTVSGTTAVNGNTTLGNSKTLDTLKIDSAITTTTAPLNINTNTLISGTLGVLGNISAYNLTLSPDMSGKIGSTYVYVGGVCVPLANTWYKIGPWSCGGGSNDVITGCSGVFHQNDSSNDHYAGAFMGTDGNCYMRLKNWGGSGSGGCPGDENAAYIFAYCFDPNGTTSGNPWGNSGCATTLQETVFGAGHGSHCPDGSAV